MSTKELKHKLEKTASQVSVKNGSSESRVSKALSKVSSLISKKTSSSSEEGSPKRKSRTSSSEDENLNLSSTLSRVSESNSGIVKPAKKNGSPKKKTDFTEEKLKGNDKTSLKVPESRTSKSSSGEDVSNKDISIPTTEISLSEIIPGSPVKKDKPEIPKIAKNVVEKISSLVTSITKQVTESIEELSSHKKKKLKESLLSQKDSDEKEAAREELTKTIKEKLKAKEKAAKNRPEERVKSRSRSRATFAGSQLLTVQQQERRKSPSPATTRKKGQQQQPQQQQQQQSSSRKERQNIPLSTITIESPRREHTYLPLIIHLTEEEAAFSDTTPQIMRKQRKSRKERNLSQLSIATESSCEIDVHRRSTQELSVRRKMTQTTSQPRITISEDRTSASDCWQSSVANSPVVRKRETTPLQYLSLDNLSHTRSRSRSHRSPAKELLWLSQQELMPQIHETDKSKRTRTQSNLQRFSKINLAYISTGTRKRKRRKKNIVAV